MTERKNILITGASSGLGEGMARAFAAKGRNLALCARRTDRLDTLAKELREQYPGITVLTKELDVNDHEAVFRVFREFRDELGSLDRVIANAGLGKGQPLGTGYFFKANKRTAETNFIGLLAQCEAALEIFLEQNAGHLVVISSVASARGSAGNITTYAATKAAATSLAEGIRRQHMKTPIEVTTLMPGYIESEMTARSPRTTFMVSNEKGVASMVAQIEKETEEAYVPGWPWSLIAPITKVAPRWLLNRLGL